MRLLLRALASSCWSPIPSLLGIKVLPDRFRVRSFQQLLIGLGRQPKAALAAARCAAAALSVAAAISALPTTARGDDVDHIFVANSGNGTIGEYTLSGATVNPSLITGLNPIAIAVSGSALFVMDGSFVAEFTTSGETMNAFLITGGCSSIAVSGTDLFCYNNNGTIGKYTTSGEMVNATLITGLGIPGNIAVSGSNLFVGSRDATSNNGTIGEYTTSGETVNASLITGLPCCVTAIAVSGSNLFVGSAPPPFPGLNLPPDFSSVSLLVPSGTIGEYATSGETVNASLITGLGIMGNIAVSGSNLFVGSFDPISVTGTIGEYTTSGETVNASLITGLPFAPEWPFGPVFAVGGGPVACGAGPELALVVPLLMWLRSRRRRVAR